MSAVDKRASLEELLRTSDSLGSVSAALAWMIDREHAVIADAAAQSEPGMATFLRELRDVYQFHEEVLEELASLIPTSQTARDSMDFALAIRERRLLLSRLLEAFS